MAQHDNPTYRELREYLVEDNGWTETEWDAFEAKHAEHFDGFSNTKLSYSEWEQLACQEGDE